MKESLDAHHHSDCDSNPLKYSIELTNGMRCRFCTNDIVPENVIKAIKDLSCDTNNNICDPILKILDDTGINVLTMSIY